MTPLALALALVVAHGSGAHDCVDVYDRTEGCSAPDTDGLWVHPDDATVLDENDSDVDGFGWRLLAASGVASVVGVALTGATFAYDVHLAGLRAAGQASSDTVDQALAERSVVLVSAIAAYTGAGLLLATSGAFLIFDPQRGNVREPFRIPPE